MAQRKTTARRAYTRSYGTRSGGRGRAPARTAARSPARGGKRAARPSVKRQPQQKVVVELVYREATEVARPQGVVETRKGSKPRL